MDFLPEIPKYGIHPNICKDNVLSKYHGVKRGNNNDIHRNSGCHSFPRVISPTNGLDQQASKNDQTWGLPQHGIDIGGCIWWILTIWITHIFTQTQQVGGWPTPKYESMERITSHILWKIKHVPNHQPNRCGIWEVPPERWVETSLGFRVMTKVGPALWMDLKNYPYFNNVNPGLINPKRLFNWEGTIEVSNHDYWGNTP